MSDWCACVKRYEKFSITRALRASMLIVKEAGNFWIMKKYIDHVVEFGLYFKGTYNF